jgi:peptidoglycan/xylan/chitin deacetylase (PgdA/CDA1 family)
MRARLGTWYSRGVCRFVSAAVGRLDATAGRQLHLSFDDGPTAQGAPELLDVLSEFNIPATFFLLGENAKQHPEHVREIVARGHKVGNHTMTHVDAWKVSLKTMARELQEATSVLEDIAQQPMHWLRPPYGRMTKGIVRWSRRHDQKIMLWDVMPADFHPPSTIDEVADVLTSKIRPGSIIVLHDNAGSLGKTAPALRQTLPALLEAGWEFVPTPDATPKPLTDAA